MKKFKNRKTLLSFIILFIIGLALGLIFITYLREFDKALIQKEINEYMDLINGDLNYLKGFINSFKINFIYITIIWLTGLISITFLINYFIIFYKGFLIGFTISSFTIIYKVRGILLSIVFMFPQELINVFLLITLSVISIKFSKKIYLKLKKNDIIDFKKNYKEYIKIYFIFLLFGVISSLIEVFINSLLVRLVV